MCSASWRPQQSSKGGVQQVPGFMCRAPHIRHALLCHGAHEAEFRHAASRAAGACGRGSSVRPLNLHACCICAASARIAFTHTRAGGIGDTTAYDSVQEISYLFIPVSVKCFKAGGNLLGIHAVAERVGQLIKRHFVLEERQLAVCTPVSPL